MTWRERAACRGIDTDLWYPTLGEPTAEACAICAGCPVRAECLDEALSVPERFGIWGGLTFKQRRELLRRRRVV